jgi:hypothetical protein
MMGLPGETPAAPPAAPAPTAQAAASHSTARTMMGLPGGPSAAAAPAAGASASAAPGATPRAFAHKTIMGMTSPFQAGPPKPLHEKPPSDAERDAATSAPSFGGAAASPDSTAPRASGASPMAATLATPGRAAPGQAPTQASEAAPKHTMLGVAPPIAVADAIRAAKEREAATRPSPEPLPPAAPPAPAPVPVAAPAPESPARSVADTKKTMVGGMAAPPPRVEAAAPAERQDDGAPAAPSPLQPPAGAGGAAAPASKVAPQSDRTMLGMPSVAARDAPPGEPPAPAFTPTLEHGDEPEGPGRRSSRPAPASSSLRPLLAALAGALLVLAIGLALWHFLSGSDLAVRVVQGEEGETLQVQVPSAEPGVKVRFLGAEQELRGGVASFPLAADALALGDNELTIGVVHGGDVESSSVRLHVAYRARVDLAGLSREQPSLDVVIEALPGSKVQVDDKPLALDASGHGKRSYPIEAQAGTKLAFAARYRIVPPDGAAAEGSLALNLPVSSLQIDRPGTSVTTDQASIEVAGAVEVGAHVSIDGQAIKVNEGRFLHRVRLPKSGEHTIHVLARVAGKAPRAVDVQVTRVADLALAAASFKVDASLTYARIAQNPAIYRGQNVSFDGRVYNVEVKGSASHLQMLVRDCPSAQRCPLWVELAQATDATVDSWVRVLGTVAGEQQFRSERGQVHTVPSVKAQYVLKLAR